MKAILVLVISLFCGAVLAGALRPIDVLKSKADEATYEWVVDSQVSEERAVLIMFADSVSGDEIVDTLEKYNVKPQNVLKMFKIAGADMTQEEVLALAQDQLVIHIQLDQPVYPAPASGGSNGGK